VLARAVGVCGSPVANDNAHTHARLEMWWPYLLVRPELCARNALWPDCCVGLSSTTHGSVVSHAVGS
jgi:hypothetical protein